MAETPIVAESKNNKEQEEKVFFFGKKFYGTVASIFFVVIISFFIVFRAITAIVEKTNKYSFNELSVHDKEFVEIVLKRWWDDASLIGGEVRRFHYNEIADVKKSLQKVLSLYQYEDCMLVSETGYVFSAQNKVKDILFINAQCKKNDEKFAVRYDFKNPNNVLQRSSYLLIGAKIEPFCVDGQTFTHFVIARKLDALRNVLKIGNYGGVGGSAVIDNFGYFIIGEIPGFEKECAYSTIFDICEKAKMGKIIPSVISADKNLFEDCDVYVFKAKFLKKDIYVTVSSIKDTSWKFLSFVPLRVFARERNKIVAIYIVLVFVCMAFLCSVVFTYIKKQLEIQRAELAHQKSLLDALSLAEQASRAKTVFLNNMSYQIRTPMNAILGFTALATTHISSMQSVKSYLEKISKSAHHLLSLINNVLDMSRIESGKMNLSEMPENLSDIIHSLQSSVQNDAKAKAQILRIDVEDVVDENILCDKQRLLQVLSNLLSNAIKYTKPRGYIIMKVRETAFRREGYATYEFLIKDNGIGMSEEFQKSIFEPFQRENTPAVSAAPGAGLGMAITKSIVDMMGGEISVKSSTRIGTEALVRLEFKTVCDNGKSLDIPSLLGKVAMVVDPDLEISGSICRMMKRLSLSATFASDIDSAISAVHEIKQNGNEINLFVLGYNGADSDFLESVRRIRRASGEDAKIIVLTELDWSDIEESALEAGVDRFVARPLFASDFRTCLLSLFCIEETKRESGNLIGLRALVAEDNDSSREITKIILNDAGIDVICVPDGEKAVETLRKRGAGYFDFVLMDIMMPILDGFEATKKIRAMKDKKLSKIPIIAMTAKSSDEDREAALGVGMNAHISKPVDVENLFEVLKKTIL